MKWNHHRGRLSLLAGLLVLWAAAVLRLADLDQRPLHFDESTNARILGTHLDEGAVPFDPVHFHGPLLKQISLPVAWARGEGSWQELSIFTLRLPVALASLVVVGLGLWIARPAGALLLATSPLLVYYGRMYIHEPLFMAVGIATLAVLLRFLNKPDGRTACLLGVGLGLMAATRETWVIPAAAWGMAFLLCAKLDGPSSLSTFSLRDNGKRIGVVMVLACMVMVLSYTSLGRHPMGWVDFFRTYWLYTPVEGHEKPFGYYLHLLLTPKTSIGMRWSELGLLLLALIGCLKSSSRTARFLLVSGAIQFLIYSLIPYKTPWLISFAWVHVGLAAGAGMTEWMQAPRRWIQVTAVVLVLLVAGWQADQSVRAAFRVPSDARNPYAYVPTSNDVKRMAEWLEGLAVEKEELRTSTPVVVGSGYWPLPWYLRFLPQAAYLQALPEDAAQRPLVFVMPDAGDKALGSLAVTHELFPRGLRHEVPVAVAIRSDLWEDP